MKKLFIITLALTLMAFGLIGCSPAEEPAEPDEDEALEMEADNGEEYPAVTVIEDRCSSCHDLGRVYRETETKRWPAIVERMVDKSPGLLDDEEFDLVVEYLQENYGTP